MPAVCFLVVPNAGQTRVWAKSKGGFCFGFFVCLFVGWRGGGYTSTRKVRHIYRQYWFNELTKALGFSELRQSSWDVRPITTVRPATYKIGIACFFQFMSNSSAFLKTFKNRGKNNIGNFAAAKKNPVRMFHTSKHIGKSTIFILKFWR